MLISFRMPAGRYERFAPSAADSLEGTEFIFKAPGQEDTTGRVLSAKVVEDGSAIELKVEVPNETIGL